MGEKNVFDDVGIVGVMTQRRLTRKDIMRDAVVCALTRFTAPHLYVA
jgi:non-canonical (house-cleaning) NTP pyrophosphatase